MRTLSQLEDQIQKLQQRANALRERKSAEIIASIHALMKEHGLTTADLDKSAGGKKRGRPLGSKNAKGPKKRTAMKSKLPPKYRDPATGMTWSGHARAPAWIKGVADRNAFLIDNAAQTAKRRSALS